MKTRLALFCCFLLSTFTKAEDLVLTINGVAHDVTLGREAVVTLPDGATLRTLVTRRPYALYSGPLCEFEYSSEYKPEISKDKDGDTKVIFMSSSGANVIIQELGSMGTEGFVDIILKQITKKDIAYGYSSVERKISQSVGGGVLSGKEIITTYHQKESIHRVLECRGKDDGILITVYFSKKDAAQADELLAQIWRTMKIKERANQRLQGTPESVPSSSNKPETRRS